mmetsp:Transcript_4689/g.10329  ORF Transcript_4689/g.10329 Transcript_4689/m.10329 type:complete len:344 (+) Transcript_4689:236-1267(+)
MSVVSAADSVLSATVSMYIVKAVVTTPVHTNIPSIDGVCSHVIISDVVGSELHASESNTPPASIPIVVAEEEEYIKYEADIKNTMRMFAAANRAASFGKFSTAASILQNPKPNITGWTKLRRSPSVSASDDPPSSSAYTPKAARHAPMICRRNRGLPHSLSRIGTVTTAREQMKALLLAVVVFNPTACAIYPIELYSPISIPANVALNLVGSPPANNFRKKLSKFPSILPSASFLSLLSDNDDDDDIKDLDSYSSIGANNQGSIINAANPNRNVEDNPTDILSSNDFTNVKLVPYNAAESRRRSRAFHTSLRFSMFDMPEGSEDGDSSCSGSMAIELDVLVTS